MQRHRDADRLDGVTVIVQVHRRRRGRADHHELADRERRQRELYADVGQDLAERTRPLCRVSERDGLVKLASDRQRVGAQEELEKKRRHGIAGDTDQKRAGRRRDAERGAEP